MTAHIVVPGLFGPFPQREDTSGIARFAHIEKVLSRAEKHGAPFGFSETLFSLFSVPFAASGSNIPTAPYTLSADSGEVEEGYVMHADPVYLRPDQDRLLLFEASELAITDEDAQHFVTAFNAHFKSDGLTLQAPHPQRWYLHWAKAPDASTKPLSDVVRRNIDLFLPQGEDAAYLRQVMNETQMLFHALGINHQRASENKPPISGVWLSGGGMLPGLGKHDFSSIDADDVLCKGLQLNSTQVGSAESLWVVKDVWQKVLQADLTGWQQALEKFDQHLSDYIHNNETFYLYACDGASYCWQPAMSRKFWRRAKPMSEYVQQEA